MTQQNNASLSSFLNFDINWHMIVNKNYSLKDEIRAFTIHINKELLGWVTEIRIRV